MSSKKPSDYVVVVRPVGDQSKIQTDFMAYKLKKAMDNIYAVSLDVRRDGNALYITEKRKEKE